MIIVLYIRPRAESVIENPQWVPTIITNKTYISLIEYQKTIVQRVPEPYQNPCTDYSLKGPKSRTHCMSRCKINKYMKKFGKWPQHYYIDKLDNEILISEINN